MNINSNGKSRFNSLRWFLLAILLLADKESFADPAYVDCGIIGIGDPIAEPATNSDGTGFIQNSLSVGYSQYGLTFSGYANASVTAETFQSETNLNLAGSTEIDITVTNEGLIVGTETDEQTTNILQVPSAFTAVLYQSTTSYQEVDGPWGYFNPTVSITINTTNAQGTIDYSTNIWTQKLYSYSPTITNIFYGTLQPGTYAVTEFLSWYITAGDDAFDFDGGYYGPSISYSGSNLCSISFTPIVPIAPQVTFNRVIGYLPPFSNYGDLLFSQNDTVDAPLGVSADQSLLLANSGPQTQVQGLVADGVTPLLFSLSLPTAPSLPVNYQISFSVNGGGSLTELVTNLYVMTAGHWTQTANLTISSTNAFAYLSGLRAEDLGTAFDQTNQVSVQVNVIPSGSTTIVSSASFYIRRPPVILVHGYNADSSTWSKTFTDTLAQDVPSDFIVPINYGVNFTNIFNPDAENTSGSLTTLARLLDQQLDQAFLTCRSNWACTRYDIVAHSQGGVLVRMLCQTNTLGTPAFGTSRPPVSSGDFYRGRFRRVITIGSPHNGSTLLRYWLDQKQNGNIPHNLPYIANLIQQKFDPFGTQIRSINSPTNPMDGRIKFNCVQCTLATGMPQNAPSCFLLFRWTDLCEDELLNSVCGLPIPAGSLKQDIVTPFGSDGIVDFASQGGGSGTFNSDFVGASVSHSKPTIAFGSPIGTETSYTGVVEEVCELLEGGTTNFGQFQLPTPLQNECVIDGVVPPSTLQNVIKVYLFPGQKTIKTQPLGEPSPQGESTCFDYVIQPTPGNDIGDDVTWSVDVYSTNGLQECVPDYSTNGVSIEVSGTNNASAIVCVDPSTIGTVVLNADYPSTNGNLIVANPVVVFTNLPGNLTNVLISPTSLNPDIGQSDSLVLWGEYDSGNTVQLFDSSGTNVQWTTSNTNIYQVNTNGLGLAITNGTAAVRANYLGLTALATITVASPGYAIIATQPQSQSVNQGQYTMLSVLASGTPPLTYQWYFDTLSIPNATNSELSVANCGLYYVVISNTVNVVTSQVANIVSIAPSIISQPFNQTVLQGGNTVFTANAVGSTPLYYQWLFNGTTISGATSSNLFLLNCTTEQAGYYELVVSNIYGLTESYGAELFVAKSATNITFSSIYSFGNIQDQYGDSLDGAYPNGGFVEANDGNLYNTTSFGGTNVYDYGTKYGTTYGTIFRLATNGLFENIYSFGSEVDAFGNALDGQSPYAGLVSLKNGILYGTTYDGGLNNVGTVFQITTNGLFTSLYSFGAITNQAGIALDGAYPAAALILGADGNLYGTTEGGGSNKVGTVFQISTNRLMKSVYSFGAITNQVSIALDGTYPAALMLVGDGLFYGTTEGGGSNNVGTVFQITTNGQFKTLYAFGAVTNQAGVPLDGAYPAAALILGADGGLYGTTAGGGSNNVGTVFQITTNGLLRSLYSFGAHIDDIDGFLDGAEPNCELTQIADGTLYGTTARGGINDNGTVFQIHTNGALTTLYWFSGGDDGANPYAGLTRASDGYFYGTTIYGGVNGVGGSFKFSIMNGQDIVTNSLILSASGFSDGQFEFIVSGGIAAQQYVLLASTDLVNWTPISTFVNTNPSIILYDPNSASYRYRFYKIGPISMAPQLISQ